MNDTSPAESQPPAPVPADDPDRHLTHVSPDTDESLPDLGVVGDTYTILVSGEDLCSPSGQEEFFRAVGVPVANRTDAPPALDDAGTAAFIAKAVALAPQYRTELLLPG